MSAGSLAASARRRARRMRRWPIARRRRLDWWLVYGPVRSGTSYMMHLIGSNARLRIGDWGLRHGLGLPPDLPHVAFDRDRARADVSRNVLTTAPAGGISVAAYEKMRIFANSDSASTEFNLVRVPPAAANKSLVISFFDVGEGASSGSVQVLKPVDAINLPTYLQNCRGTGVTNGPLSDCKITGITPSGYNGKYQEIRVPIPSTYSCTVTSQGGCWFRVKVSFGSGQVTDATTWTARIDGEPVRLIE